MSFQFLPYEKIDKTRWDETIDEAANSLIYAKSSYLDCMADNWCAVIYKDYEAVMPLTWRRKLAIRYLYQPAFVQQLGIFSCTEITPETLNGFKSMAASHFQFAELTLNFANIVNDQDAPVVKNNFIITPSDFDVFKTRDYLKKRLARSQRNNLSYHISHDYNSVINLYKEQYQDKIHFSDRDFKNFSKVCGYYDNRGDVVIREAHFNNKTVAVALLLRYNMRLYNLVSYVNAEGRKLLANYFLYASILQEFKGRNLTLDLEGSDIPGIAFFYKQMASHNQKYLFIKWNHLPPLIRLFK